MEPQTPTFFQRLGMAFVCFFRVLFKPMFAQRILPAYREWKALPTAAPVVRQAETPAPAPAPQPHASGLFILSVLQREGRFIDFLQEDVAAFSDAEVGAAARVVHEGCRKVVRQYLSLEPVLKDSEGARIQVPAGFDAQRIRLTGNVTGQGPFTGSLKHHGWVTRDVKLPNVPTSLDPTVIAPAEVELS